VYRHSVRTAAWNSKTLNPAAAVAMMLDFIELSEGLITQSEGFGINF
jgi:hypothetical protein